MHSSRNDLPAVLEVPGATIRAAEWGALCVEAGFMTQAADPREFFKGLPDDRCQCPHWGYVISGTLRYNTANGQEVFQAGDVYHIGPGHTPQVEEGTEYVEFSPADEIAKTAEVVGAERCRRGHAEVRQA